MVADEFFENDELGVDHLVGTKGKEHNRFKGQCGEDRAIEYLKGLGWTLLARNVYQGHREIDAIFVDTASVVVFVEVKARNSVRYGTALEGISHRKQRHIRCAAAQWLRESNQSFPAIRFDVVALDYPDQITHVQDAF